MTSLKTSIKTITYLSDIGCLEIQGASLQIPADSNGIVNVDLIAYYVSTVEASEITPGEADAVVNVTLDYR